VRIATVEEVTHRQTATQMLRYSSGTDNDADNMIGSIVTCAYMCFCTEMFGVSDHDLMFALKANKAVESDASSDDDDNIRFIEDKVSIDDSLRTR